jgi:hypothetical protein
MQNRFRSSVLILRIFLALTGILLLVLACFAKPFRNLEGDLTSLVCLPVAIGLACLFLVWSAGRSYGSFNLWFVLGLVGQAVTLQIIDAGNRLHYQHYLNLAEVVKNQPWLFLWLIGQAVFVALGIYNRKESLGSFIRKHFRTWQLIGILLGLILTSTALSRSFVQYAAELAFASFLLLLQGLTLILIAWTLPQELITVLHDKLFPILYQRSLRKWQWKVFSHQFSTKRTDPYPLLGMLWIFILTAFLSYFVYQRHPHIQDEVIYLYQARYMAEGRLTTPAYPLPEAFSIYMIPYRNSQWYSPFPPGWSALLAVGTIMKIPWLVNPVLAAICVLLAYNLAKELYNLPTARVMLLLLCCSPWFIFMGMNFMSHTFMLFATLFACFGIIKARSTGRSRWGFLAGISVGVVSLIRPLDGLAIAGLLGLWALGLGGKRLNTGAIATYVLGVVLIGGMILPYNLKITGHALSAPLTEYYEEYYGHNVYALGFGADRGINWAIDPYPGYSPFEAILNALLNFFSINTELFGWSMGSLAFVFIFLFSGKYQRSDILLIVMIVSVLVLYSLFWFSGGPDFGARYWYLTIIPWILLSVRGIQTLTRKIIDGSDKPNDQRARIATAILLLCVFTVVNYLPWRSIDKYFHYLNMRPDISTLAQKYQFGKSIVLIQGESHPDYASAWINNPLDPLSDATIYAHDLNQEIRAQILQAYPDRPVWIIAGPSITQGTYQVLAGPLNPEEALQP